MRRIPHRSIPNWALSDEKVQEPVDARLMLARTRDAYGVSLLDHSKKSTLLMVFIRHLGCTFCFETLADLAKARSLIEENLTRIVLIHMSPHDTAHQLFARYGLEDVPRVSDPERLLYQGFGLERGSFRSLFGLKVLKRGWKATVGEGHGVRRLQGDGLQMPGVFLVKKGFVVRSFVHESVADRPDYLALSHEPDWTGTDVKAVGA